jgi:hypothetical protein
MHYDLTKKRYDDKEKEKVPRSLQYPERLSDMLNQGGISDRFSSMEKAIHVRMCLCEGGVLMAPPLTTQRKRW